MRRWKTPSSPLPSAIFHHTLALPTPVYTVSCAQRTMRRECSRQLIRAGCCGSGKSGARRAQSISPLTSRVDVGSFRCSTNDCRRSDSLCSRIFIENVLQLNIVSFEISQHTHTLFLLRCNWKRLWRQLVSMLFDGLQNVARVRREKHAKGNAFSCGPVNFMRPPFCELIGRLQVTQILLSHLHLLASNRGT